jgi:hypothetical protein
MQRFLSFCLFSWLFLTASATQADEKFDPAAQARIVAPYIDEQTFLIAHVNFTRIKIDSAVDTLGRLLPDDKDDILQSKAMVQQTIDTFIQAGGKDVYIGYRVNRQDFVFLVIPLGDKFDQQAIEKNDIFKGLALKRAGNVMIGSLETREAAARLEKNKPDPRPELAPAFETAGDNPIQVLLLQPKYFRRVIEETMPQLPKEIGGSPTNILTKGLSWAAMGINFTPQITARLVIQSPDASSAAALSTLLADVLKHVAELPVIKELLPTFAGLIPYITPKAEGDKLVLNIDEKNAELSNLLGKVQTVLFSEARNNASRMQSINNMKQIGLAMHNYHDANKHFPAAAIYSKDGKPLLSWRVALLPMMEYGNLYDQFHLDEPWDSEHNKKLIDKMPAEYRSPKSKLKEPGMTNYVVPVGPGTVFEGREGMSFKDIKDGTAHTILAVEVDNDHAVIWTKPDDLPYNPNDPSKGLGGVFKNVFVALFCNGSVRIIDLNYADEKLRAAFSAAAGDPAPIFD